MFETFSVGLMQLGTGNIVAAVKSFGSLKSKASEVGEAVSVMGRDLWSAAKMSVSAWSGGSASMVGNFGAIGSAAGVASTRTAKALDAAQKKLDQTKAKLAELKESAKTNAASMYQALESTIPAFEGVQRTSRVTASRLNANLRSEIAEARRWSSNLQALLKRGADPKFVQALAQKGPQYVAAYVRGSDRQLRTGETLWKRREQAKAAATKTSSTVAERAVSDMIAKMNRRIRQLENVVRKLTLKSTFTPPPGFSMHDIVGRARGGIIRRHRGGVINEGTTPTADDVLARLSRGEFVVNARATSQNRELLEAINRGGLPGFATGGAVGFDTEGPNAARMAAGIQRVFERIGARVEAGIERNFKLRVMAFTGGSGAGFGSGSWMRAIAELRREGVPYNIISTYRPGARTRASGSVSFHALNRAVDLTGPNMLRIWQALTDTNPTELIYSRAPYYKSRRGWRPISQLDPITRADHYSHVHAAYHRGGRLHEDILGVGPSGRTYALQQGETVIPRGESGLTVNITVIGNVYGGRAGAREFADTVHTELLKKKRNNGGVLLGLT